MNLLLLLLSLSGSLSKGNSLEQNNEQLEERFESLPFGGFINVKTGGFINNKIIGGTAATPGELPYQISFQTVQNGKRWHFCGGSIISQSKIATAAHCCAYANTLPPLSLKVVAGAQNMHIPENIQQIISVQRITIHPSYNATTLDHDACKLFLSSPLSLNTRVALIPPCSSEPRDNAVCTVSGWGKTSTSSNTSPNALQKLDLAIVPRSTCAKDYLNYNPVTDELDFVGTPITRRMICAGKVEGKSTCSGDSGGPLACTHGNKRCLGGVVSWGKYPCGDQMADHPSVFTNVANLKNFYESN